MKYNFTERIKNSLINFVGSRRDDDNEINAGSTEFEIGKIKSGLLSDKGSNEFNEAFRTALKSWEDLSNLGADAGFMKSLKEKHGNDGIFDSFKGYVDKAVKAQELADKNSKVMLAKSRDRIETTNKLGQTLSSAMESPAREFFQGMFDMLANHQLNAAKIRALKDDETDFDIEKELNKATGSNDALGDAEKKSGVKVESKEEVDEDKKKAGIPLSKSSIEVPDADLNIEVTDEASARKLGEALGKKMYGDEYDQKIFDDVFQHGKDTVGDDPDALAAYLRRVYKGAVEMDFSNKYNFTERIHRSFH